METIELLSARWAVLLVQELGFADSIFKGNLEKVIKALRNNEWLNSSIGYLIQDTLSFVNSLQSWSFSHIGGQGNDVAHALARRVRLSFPFQVWMEFVPPELDYVLSSNFSILQ